jgi:allantoin racemase
VVEDKSFKKMEVKKLASFLVINPNTSQEMTKVIEETVNQYIHSHHKADIISAKMGPRSLETFYEYGLATVGVISTLQEIDLTLYDGILLACFGDPGLYAIKEISSVPVIGIAEASISVSLLLGSSFGIFVALEKAVPMMDNMVQQYGLKDRFKGVFPLGLPVLDLEKDKLKTTELLLEKGREAVNQGAEVLILGCAGLTGFSDLIEEQLGVTVVDPIRVGFKTLESIVESNVNVSKKGLYKSPSSKEIVGMDFLNKGIIHQTMNKGAR